MSEETSTEKVQNGPAEDLVKKEPEDEGYEPRGNRRPLERMRDVLTLRAICLLQRRLLVTPVSPSDLADTNFTKHLNKCSHFEFQTIDAAGPTWAVYMQFRTSKDANAALEQLPALKDGKMHVQQIRFNTGRMQNQNVTTMVDFKLQLLNPVDEENTRDLPSSRFMMVSNVPEDVSDEEMESLFSSASYVYVRRFGRNDGDMANKCKGTTYVEYATAQLAKDAFEASENLKVKDTSLEVVYLGEAMKRGSRSGKSPGRRGPRGAARSPRPARARQPKAEGGAEGDAPQDSQEGLLGDEEYQTLQAELKSLDNQLRDNKKGKLELGPEERKNIVKNKKAIERKLTRHKRAKFGYEPRKRGAPRSDAIKQLEGAISKMEPQQAQEAMGFLAGLGQLISNSGLEVTRDEYDEGDRRRRQRPRRRQWRRRPGGPQGGNAAATQSEESN